MIVTLYYVVLSLLAVYGVHRLHLVRLRRSFEGQALTPETSSVPSLAVQLPLFNEPNVCERLIDAVASLRYRGPLEIQVLDDSTDQTCEIVRERVELWRNRGINIRYLRRDSRAGYKAGALAWGMLQTDAELFAIFDADFVPDSDFLERMVPHLQQPGIGMVQARWGHINREDSSLTRAQSIFLDGHFAVESAARYLSGVYFNFNGTAGIWKREAIIAAGGWSASTLTEDLDLSYRAQIAGWKFVFVSSVEVPAELPATLSGFQGQQHRWAKGSIQTARKLLPSILRSDAAWRVKVEAFFHLTNNSAYLLMLLLALLLVPSLAIRHGRHDIRLLLIDVVLFVASTASLLFFYAEGQKRAGGRKLKLREFATLLPLGIALTISNSAAVLEGLVQKGGTFRRTGKRGAAASAPREGGGRAPVAESILAMFYLFSFLMLVTAGHYEAIPFLLLFLTGFGYLSIRGWQEVFSRA